MLLLKIINDVSNIDGVGIRGYGHLVALGLVGALILENERLDRGTRLELNHVLNNYKLWQ